MRGDFKDRKILGGVKITYEIIGLNQDRLISELRKRDFLLQDIKKLSNRRMYITVSLRESKNFFAITKNLCYNIKKVRTFGKGLPLYKLTKNLGLVLGAVVFLCVALLANDYIFKVSYSGSGSVYNRQVSEYLSSRGITRFSRFSSFKTELLEDEILADNPNLTFVSVQKKGNTLAVYMALKKQPVGVAKARAQELKSSVSGTIESIKLYRGTALVGVGDSVAEGDLLAVGYTEIKEQTVETGVLAYVTILQDKTFIYRLSGLNQQDLAIAMAEEEEQKQIVNSSVTVTAVSGRENVYEYSVNVQIRHVIYSE